MKKLLSITLLLVLINLTSCQNTAQNPAQTSPAQASATPISATQTAIKTTMAVDEYDKKLSATPTAQLIDVRTPEEYAAGHLKNAVNINFNAGDFEEQLGKIDKSKPVFVYCLAGGRSAKAANKMAEKGFTEVYNMEGGFTKWTEAGKPVEK